MILKIKKNTLLFLDFYSITS